MTVGVDGRGEGAASGIGGRPALDFVNSLEDWGASYDALVWWSECRGLLAPGDAAQLAALAPDEHAALYTLRRAVTLRHALYGVFSAVAAGRAPAPRSLQALNDALPGALSELRLVARADGEIAWDWNDRAIGADRPLWPVVRDAADLLTGTERGRVRECAGEGCDRLFVDRSRNRSRRWCEMTHCGMLAKSRRHYARTRAARGSAPPREGA
jgi:predicted RNA-binding Zn ribbon-like protein